MITARGVLAIVLFAAMFVTGAFVRAQESETPKWTVVGSDLMNLIVMENEVPLFEMTSYMHGWGWKRAKMDVLPEVKDGVRVYEQKLAFYERTTDREPIGPGQMGFRYQVEQRGPETFRITYVCTPDVEMQFAMPKSVDDAIMTGGPQIEPCDYFKGGRCLVELADGTSEEYPMPVPRGATKSVSAVTCITEAGEATRFSFEPAIYFHRDFAQARFWMQSGRKVGAGESYVQVVTMELPEPARFEPDNRWVDTSDWFALSLENDFQDTSAISMARWQDSPAGEHGFMTMEGSQYKFEDGTPAKLWGVNLINWKVDEALFDQWGDAMAKYGINLGRMVGFGRPNYPNKWAHYIKVQDVNDGLKLDPEAMKLFDYGFARLKGKGVYVTFSPFYGWYPTPADKDRLINHEELMGVLRKAFPCQGSFYGVTCFAPDVQDLQIQFHVNLLNHVNPYTGLRYADDPALVFVELQNEENTFLQLWNLGRNLDRCPTYKKLYLEGFARWLRSKYGTQDALAEAWGSELGRDEVLSRSNINPLPRYFAEPTPRIADQMAYVYHTQSEYYRRFAEAVRGTGYKGGLSASCWQASNWIGHLYNVLSDRETGHIDRHNYATADFKNPGVGLLSAGLQAVLDRPFSYSEWHGGYRFGMSPDAPMVAVYGMGLQGWDLSMEFAWAEAGALPYDHLGINDCVNDFGILCQYPALARMVRRMDVQEGDVVANRRISIPALKEKADVGFVETFSLLGGANNKRFDAAVPQAALAAGRVVLEYVDGPVDAPIVDHSPKFIDTDAHTVRSNTGQLLWDTSGEGYFTVNTAGTKAVVGYGGGREHELGEVTVEPQTRFAHVYVTALDEDDAIEDAERLLITTMARMVDKGTRFDEFSERPIVRVPPKVGPLMIEPVRVAILLKGRADAKVYALDHDGRRQPGTAEIPVERTPDGVRFLLDGAQTKAVYYLVEMQP